MLEGCRVSERVRCVLCVHNLQMGCPRECIFGANGADPEFNQVCCCGIAGVPGAKVQSARVPFILMMLRNVDGPAPGHLAGPKVAECMDRKSKRRSARLSAEWWF